MSAVMSLTTSSGSSQEPAQCQTEHSGTDRNCDLQRAPFASRDRHRLSMGDGNTLGLGGSHGIRALGNAIQGSLQDASGVPHVDGTALVELVLPG